MNNIAELYQKFIKGHKISTDTRNITQGDVFIALKGDNFNGNMFAIQALNSGASTAFIDEPEYLVNEQCVLVPDCLTFLQEVAHYHREQLNIPIIGITGTNGKTTTKELCNAVLSSELKCYATQGNLNNHIGVPLTLLNIEEHTEIAIIEMGANHPGEIKRLCRIADPDYGIITNIGEAHLEGFGSFENIIQTKKELYDYINEKNGQLFVCADDSLLSGLSQKIKRVTYGKTGDYIKGEVKQKNPYLVFSLKTLQGDLYVKTHLTGGYNFENAMAACCVGKFFNIPLPKIVESLEKYQPENMRSQLIKTARNMVIMDAYNANPSSMKAAISNFADFKERNKIVLLGEMLELGKESPAQHRTIVELASSLEFQYIFLVGKEFNEWRDNPGNILFFEDTENLSRYLKEHPLNSYYIFVKGSRGNKLEHIIEHL